MSSVVELSPGRFAAFLMDKGIYPGSFCFLIFPAENKEERAVVVDAEILVGSKSHRTGNWPGSTVELIRAAIRFQFSPKQPHVDVQYWKRTEHIQETEEAVQAWWDNWLAYKDKLSQELS